MLHKQHLFWVLRRLYCRGFQHGSIPHTIDNTSCACKLEQSLPLLHVAKHPHCNVLSDRFELGVVPPTIEDVRVFPGTDPGAEDIFLEFDFEWRGDQNISLLLNPAPKFLQSVPGLSTIVNKIFTWKVRTCYFPTQSLLL